MRSFLFFLMLLFLAGCADESNKNAQEISGRVGELSPEILAKNTSGKEVKLSDENSRVKVLVFFQNGCASCLNELPQLDNFLSKNMGKFSAFAIDSFDSPEVVRVLGEQLGLKKIQVLSDTLKITGSRFSIFATPTTIIIKDGIIRERILGERPWVKIEEKISSLL